MRLSGPPQRPRRVVLHVGAPKTGTSFVQDRMFRSREQLARMGTLYPADRFDAHFLAALDLMELPWGGLEKEAGGRWDRLAAEVRGWSGDVVISHEILATASREQVARALSSLAGGYVVHGTSPRPEPAGRAGRAAGSPRARDRAVLAAMLESVLWADAARVGAAEEQGTGP